MFGAEIQVREADVAVDHPAGLMVGGQDAQFVGATLVAGLIAAKGAGAAGDVARQRVMARRFVILGVMVVAPQGCGQAVTELGAVLKASIGRAVEGLKDL
ncbi:hypothetical protein D3C72_2268570 [compost metagenome]